MSDTQLEAAQAHLAGIQLQLLDEILPAAAFLRQLEEFRTSVSPFSCLQISGSPHHQLLPTIIPNPLEFDCVDSLVSQSEPPSCLLRLFKKKKSYNGNTQNTQLEALRWYFTNLRVMSQRPCLLYTGLINKTTHLPLIRFACHC